MSDGFGNKFKEFFGFGEVDSYQDPYFRDGAADSRERADEHDHRDRGISESREARYGGRDRYSREEDDFRDRSRAPRDYEARPSRYVREESVSRPAPRAHVEPQYARLSLSSYTQAGEIAEIIKTGDVAVFNLGGMEKAEATRVLDFTAGLARGLDAKLKKLRGVRNFVLIPADVTLEQSQLDKLAEDL
ncbi:MULTISPECIES: cell division protein SepF [Corynebacterium]|uniref:cell division protein SepF n=1 Tax=Corynebacterium TaxID=1716 RepID=UPI0008A3B95C|nr:MULTISPECIES: cell division protein SepF [Corynebacterium]OFT88424.1 hypothetical protein HMPREF3098_08380 [Corynebacterium sp. HMSC28B08]